MALNPPRQRNRPGRHRPRRCRRAGRRREPHRRRSQRVPEHAMNARGFTLVEMLVALLIFAMLSAVGVTVMAYAADNQGVVKARMDRLGELQSARAMLKAHLTQSAVRPLRRRDGPPARTPYLGTATQT